MAIYAIADLHLGHAVDKPMDVFGQQWDAHIERVEQSWRRNIQSTDTVLLPGDISWAMNIDEARADLSWIGELPGHKVMIRGNHDYWWSGIGKVRAALPHGIVALQNDATRIERFVVCGSRGWLLPTHPRFTNEDETIYRREIERLKLSLDAAQKFGDEIIAMLHYPPCPGSGEDTDFTKLLDLYQVKMCIYGHLHGAAHRFAFHGFKNKTEYKLVSSDFLHFSPLLLDMD